ncbi:acyl carrier protein [Kiloniella litopenaei]|uniref:acyl carrier protein n=1 Tax=Kiloniella litopenaei TaxID=1549748 RepID=UPI003BAC7C08
MQSLKTILSEEIGLAPDAVHEELSYANCSKWDSFTSVNLIMRLETEYSISLSTDEMAMCSSYKGISDILRDRKIDID